MSEKPYRVWDLPVRLFHWCLVILIAISIYTGENGGFNEMDYHMLSGYAVLALILFRIIWGFVGSRHARFSDFVRPTKVAAYTRSLFNREKDETNPGHNPLGGLSVVAILLVLLIQGLQCRLLRKLINIIGRLYFIKKLDDHLMCKGHSQANAGQAPGLGKGLHDHQVGVFAY